MLVASPPETEYGTIPTWPRSQNVQTEGLIQDAVRSETVQTMNHISL
jgi:hypothetical protein